MDNSTGPHLKAWCCNRMAIIATRQPGEFFPPKYSTISYKRYCKVQTSAGVNIGTKIVCWELHGMDFQPLL